LYEVGKKRVCHKCIENYMVTQVKIRGPKPKPPPKEKDIMFMDDAAFYEEYKEDK
jgi:hypothetical protein